MIRARFTLSRVGKLHCRWKLYCARHVLATENPRIYDFFRTSTFIRLNLT